MYIHTCKHIYIHTYIHTYKLTYWSKTYYSSTMLEVILRVKVPLKHLISSPYDTENVSKRKIYGTFEKRIFRVPYIVRNWLFSV